MAGMSAEYGMASLEASLRLLMQSARTEPGAEDIKRVEDIEAELSRTAAALREALDTELV